MTTHSTNPVKFLRCLVILNFRPMTIITHPARDPQKRTRGFKSLGIRSRSGRHVFNLKRIFLYTLDKYDKGLCVPVTHAPVLGLADARGLLAHILADFRGRRVVLYFYARDNTPGCATESPKSLYQLRLVRSQKNYGKKIYGNYSIDRDRP